MVNVFFVFFFFKQKTAYEISAYWSSDVCSSDLAAQRGMKTAQYLLGIMFLKGEYVDQSLAIGMAWLGVAGEADQDDWHATYEQIYDTLPANLQAAIDAKVATYIELYGVRTQKIRCDRRARIGQRRIEEICGKNEIGRAHV